MASTTALSSHFVPRSLKLAFLECESTAICMRTQQPGYLEAKALLQICMFPWLSIAADKENWTNCKA
eukprot:11462934-Karenia_brevis.AAC.1